IPHKSHRRWVMANEFSAMSRRDFLCFTGKTAAVSTGILLSGCAQTATQATGDPAASLAPAIDIHHHYFPPELVNEIKQHANALGIEHFAPKDGGESPLSIKFPGGNRLNLDRRLAEVENRLQVMSQGKVAIATVEVQTSAVGYELDGHRGESWSKLYNEAIQNLVKQHPSRFVGIATVPLQDPPRAARVLEHAILDLKMSGVTIASNVVGKYYDSREFDPFWRKAEELDVLLIMHPEWVAGVETVEYLKRMVGTEHVMVGTDYPYDLGDWMAAEKIEQMNCTQTEREAMLYGNARALLKIPASQQV